MTVSVISDRPDLTSTHTPILKISGGVPLRGSVVISGSKNAALPMLAACLLTGGECTLSNVPNLSDVRVMIQLLRALGAEVEFNDDAGRVFINAAKITSTEAPSHLVGSMRASFLVAGPLLARKGSFETSLPGGCALGSRPVDVDLRGFRQMGAVLDSTETTVNATVSGSRLQSARIFMDYPSHTGTENLLMAATLAEGRTRIVNASCEPEIVALGLMLIHMGARIEGLGSPTITVEGVDRLHGVSEKVLPDRLEAGTYALAAVVTNGEIQLDRLVERDMLPLRAKLEEAGAEVWGRGDSMLVRPGRELHAVEIQTLPFPGFPTDLQAAFAVLMTQAEGTSKIKERVFDDRLRYIDELNRMGANASVEELGNGRLGNEATIIGPTQLTGATVKAIDIRAGAGMVLAGLAASGQTVVTDTHHLDRGYDRLVPKLQELGAIISGDSFETA